MVWDDGRILTAAAHPSKDRSLLTNPTHVPPLVFLFRFWMLPLQRHLPDVLHLAGTSVSGSVPNEVCALVGDNGLSTLSSDCGGANPAVSCDCCTFCFDDDQP